MTTHFHHDHGQCTTFKPKEGLRVVPGEYNGYKIIIQHNTVRGNWNLFIHDPEEYFAGGARYQELYCNPESYGTGNHRLANTFIGIPYSHAYKTLFLYFYGKK
jgi:hypothetical protein